jgi:hypothetical protein
LRCRNLFAVLAAAGLLACGRERGGSGGSREIHIALMPAAGTRPVRVVVTGVDEQNLKALRDAPNTGSPWDALLRVTVAPNGSPNAPAVAGRYVATDTSIEFEPMYPFDAGRQYAVSVDPRRFPSSQNDTTITTTIALPKANLAASTTVSRIYPTNLEVPENELRMYIEFSAPMSREPGVSFVHLIDNTGREVTNAFLPLEADFWNPAHTRYTLFLDPGRVKRGIRPNEQMGRPLRAGRAYALIVDSAWRDANGLPLAKSFRYEFRAGPAVEQGIDIKSWRIAAPRAGTRDTLVVTFPLPLDHGLLQRAIGVERGSAQPVPGDISIGRGELQWMFVPREKWTAGDYRLVILPILEDVSGNRVGRAFEVDMFEHVDSSAAQDRHYLPFKIR